MGSIFLLTVEWAYQPRSLGWRENLGTRLWAYNWEGGGEVRYFANSLHAGAAMMGSKTSSILQFSLDTCSRLRSVLS